MRLTGKKKWLAAAAGVVALGVAGTAAFAYWTSSGNGSGTASTGSAGAWKVTVDGDTSKVLSPDGPIETITYHVKNMGTGVQHLNQVDASIAVDGSTAYDSVTPAFSAQNHCTKDDFSVGSESPGVTHSTLNSEDFATGQTKDYTVTIQLVDNHAPQDNCQNVNPPLYVAAS